MAFLRNKDDNQDKWKDKYYHLLDSQEQLDNSYRANEELLCKTIVRFALAIKGLNRELDPHLNRIRNILKDRLQTEQLKTELEAFSNVLMTLGDNNSKREFDSFLLFEFLHNQYPQHQAVLDTIQDKYDHQGFKNTQSLIVSLLEVVDEKPAGSVYFGIELPDSEHKAIRAHLMHLLEFTDIPSSFSEQLEQIKARLTSEINIKSLVSIFDNTVSLLLAVKKHQALEQFEMTQFLSRLTEQLAEIAITATGVDHATEKASLNRNHFDESVTRQMVDLQNISNSATHLEALKQLVNTHLTSISQQIQVHNQQEQLERENFQVDLHSLTQKIREMETESTELKVKLEVAQQNATRDPLTHLPNRLAFEERMTSEVARCQRNGLPLTMLIWDIDYFKKINDSYGHKTGDKALIVIAQILQEHCRKSDFVARFGGEEFVMLFPDTDVQTALLVANKLRTTVEKANFKASGDKISITLSCGLSQYLTSDTHETIFERADKALYQAKQNGRNQCIVI
ncbi:GGDEF domain-containing protein [Methylomonas sp. AM2-LC]|uniref:GGDEF domain-containing protein n=1 Tax=Methylomonas sp. AM2-LC TaxID=3153301 RepID=UPI00326723C1